MADGTKSNPALLVFGRFVALRNSVGIIKGQGRSLKTHAVLEKISSVLGFVPLETHGRCPAPFQTIVEKIKCQYICMYLKAGHLLEEFSHIRRRGRRTRQVSNAQTFHHQPERALVLVDRYGLISRLR